MYVVDITRDKESDLICANDSMSAKSKTINYIIDFAFANYGIYVEKELLDSNLDMNYFSLINFMKNNYSKNLSKDLKIQSFYTDKEHCLFVKYFDNKGIPSIYAFEKNEKQKANALFKFLVNDSLINKYKDNLEEYEKVKIKDNSSLSYNSKDINCEVISLYKGGMFLEELLNNATSLNDVKHDLGGMDI